jgi:predicted DNA-binding ribbon-helix-helix protein
MLSGQRFGLGGNTTPGQYHSRMLDRWAANASRPESARHSAKGYAVETRTIGGVFMKSAVVKRSVVVAGHKTSVSLEDAFWNALKGIAHERHMSLSQLVAEIDAQRQLGNLSSALRLFVLDFYRTQLFHQKGGHAGNHEMIGDTAPAFS